MLALCRQEEPEVEIRFEVALSQQIKGLHDDLYDVGFARADEVGDGIVALPVWNDPLMVAVPARHPLLAHKRIPLEEVLRYPLVLCDPQACEGHARQVERILRREDMEPLVAERVASCDLMMALVSAGFALGLTGAAHIAASQEQGVVARPLVGRRRCSRPICCAWMANLRKRCPLHRACAGHRIPKVPGQRQAISDPPEEPAMKKAVPLLLAVVLIACGPRNAEDENRADR